jgi:agmatine/peptidylarginine deiminase
MDGQNTGTTNSTDKFPQLSRIILKSHYIPVFRNGKPVILEGGAIDVNGKALCLLQKSV